MSLTTDVPSVERVEIDTGAVRAFSHEDDFTELAVGLLVEVGSYVLVAGSILPPPPQRWNRHEAVLVGHLVRLYKLISGLLDQTCQRRQETTFIFARLAFECIVNTMFLIRNDRPEVIASYIEFSLRHEKRLRDRIRANIGNRGGEVFPIEERMLHSIQAAADNSGVDLDQISPPQNWGGKNLFEKAKEVGLEAAYLGAFAGPSHSVHGNWQDLLEYHLDFESDGYLPELRWHSPRPQLLTTVATLAILTLEMYFSEIVGPAAGEIGKSLPDVKERVLLLVHLHEEFLGRGKASVEL